MERKMSIPKLKKGGETPPPHPKPTRRPLRRLRALLRLRGLRLSAIRSAFVVVVVLYREPVDNRVQRVHKRADARQFPEEDEGVYHIDDVAGFRRSTVNLNTPLLPS